MPDTVFIGGKALALEDVAAAANGATVQLAPEAEGRIAKARAVVEKKARADQPVYGVTTGFGALAEVKVPPEQIRALQRNLILSHAAGVGRPLSKKETRAMMVLRAQTLAAGHSGTRLDVVALLLEMLNRGVH